MLPGHSGLTPSSVLSGALGKRAGRVSAGSKQFIKTHSETVRVFRGLMKGKIKGSGWLEVNK